MARLRTRKFLVNRRSNGLTRFVLLFILGTAILGGSYLYILSGNSSSIRGQWGTAASINGFSSSSISLNSNKIVEHAYKSTKPDTTATGHIATTISSSAKPSHIIPRQTPWEVNKTRKSICNDECKSAANGVCDDGRVNIGSTRPTPAWTTVACDLGTDCTDCGAFEFYGPEWALEWTPVADILAKNISIRARKSKFDDLSFPGFTMAYTDPKHDVDVSAHVHASGMVERHISQIWYLILKDGCSPQQNAQIAEDQTRRPGLVVDVGGNFGWFSLLSASMGCRVVSWEPVPYFAAFFKYNLLVNNLTGAVELRENIVGEHQGETLKMTVPNRGIWGTAGVGGANIDPNIANNGEYDLIDKTAERIDNVIEEDVLIMKADVEGFEPSVLAGCRGLFERHDVANVIMEYSPGVPERHGNWNEMKRNPVMLAHLLRQGFTILHINRLGPQKFGEPLPELPHIPIEAVINDIRDADLLINRTLGCPPPELATERWFTQCNWLPESLDPRSFRSSFGYNTNVWAFKIRAPYALIGPPSTVVPLSFDLSKEYFTSTGYGMHFRKCSHLPPQSQVASRCPCAKQEECGALEAAVRKAAAEGKLAREDTPVTVEMY